MSIQAPGNPDDGKDSLSMARAEGKRRWSRKRAKEHLDEMVSVLHEIARDGYDPLGGIADRVRALLADIDREAP